MAEKIEIIDAMCGTGKTHAIVQTQLRGLFMKEYTPLEHLTHIHEDAKNGFKDNYKFDVKHHHIIFENRTSRDSWEKKRKRVENKIKRLHKEIKELEEEESIYSRSRDWFQANLDAAIENEDQLREIFDETN